MNTAFAIVTESLFPSSERPASANKIDAGTHSWPFSIVIPAIHGQAGQTLPLPPSFSQPGFPTALAYNLVLSVKKKGLFTNDEE